MSKIMGVAVCVFFIALGIVAVPELLNVTALAPTETQVSIGVKTYGRELRLRHLPQFIHIKEEIMPASEPDKPINTDRYAFVAGENRYGNHLETVGFPYRRIVSNGRKIFVGMDNLFQCNPDGSDKQVIYDQPLNQAGREQIGQISFYDGWVYFSDYCELWTFFESSRLYRIRPDGSCIETIYDSSVNKQGRFLSFQIVNDRIYMDGSYGEIAPDGERFGIRSMSLTGEDIINICDAPAYILTVSDKLYYRSDNKMYISDLDGSNCWPFTEEGDIWYAGINIDNGYLYYYNIHDNSLYRIEMEGGVPQLIISDRLYPKNVFVKNDYLYFTYSYEIKVNEYESIIKHRLVRTLVTGDGEEELISDDVTRLKNAILTPVIIGDWIYFNGAGIRKVKLDGSEDILIEDWFY